MTGIGEKEPNMEARQAAEAFLAERMAWVKDAVEIFTDRNDDPLEVFPEPTIPRSAGLAIVTVNGETRDITAEEEPKLRDIEQRFGVGIETDAPSKAKIQYVEGGKIWKVEAELETTENAEAIIVGGSSTVTVADHDKAAKSDEERTAVYARNKFGTSIAGMTEYQMVRALIETYPDFEPAEQERVLPFGYELSEGNPLVQGPTGQFTIMGRKSGKQIILFRNDQENLPDGKFRFRPDVTRILEMIHEGMDEDSVGFVTSNLYGGSKTVDMVRAGFERGVQFDVGLYGRATLAAIQGKEMSEPPAFNQMPGEMHAIYQSLVKLQAALGS